MQEAKRIFKKNKFSVYYERRTYRVRIWNKKFAKLFLEMTNNKTKLPGFIFHLHDEDSIRLFLRTFWDDEGYISSRGELYGYTTSHEIAAGLIRLQDYTKGREDMSYIFRRVS